MIVNSKEILLKAKKNHNGVAAPDFIDLDSARIFVQVAEKLNRPIILSFAQSLNHILSIEEAAAIGHVVSNQVRVPIVLHLDHGQDLDYIKKAIELGFSSVMIDASMKPLEENINLTQQVVALAHRRDITVEAEIGHVGQNETDGAYEGEVGDSIYTKVKDAIRFVNETHVDSLAVSIGTSHGIYKNNVTPVLNFKRLEELNKELTIPLVLHGSSGTGDENLQKCVQLGISKINIFSAIMRGAIANIDYGKQVDYVTLKKDLNQNMANVLEHNIINFSNQK